MTIYACCYKIHVGTSAGIKTLMSEFKCHLREKQSAITTGLRLQSSRPAAGDTHDYPHHPVQHRKNQSTIPIQPIVSVTQYPKEGLPQLN